MYHSELPLLSIKATICRLCMQDIHYLAFKAFQAAKWICKLFNFNLTSTICNNKNSSNWSLYIGYMYEKPLVSAPNGRTLSIKSFRWKRTQFNKKLCKVTTSFSVSSWSLLKLARTQKHVGKTQRCRWNDCTPRIFPEIDTAYICKATDSAIWIFWKSIRGDYRSQPNPTHMEKTVENILEIKPLPSKYFD